MGVGGAHVLDERVGAGEHGGGGVGGGVVAGLHHRHERTLPSTVATLGVGGHGAAHVEVALVGSLGRRAKLSVAQGGGALPRGGIRHVHQVEEREELPGDKLGPLARVLGDEVEQVDRVDREHALERLELLARDRRGDNLALAHRGRRLGARLASRRLKLLAHDAPVHGSLGGHELRIIRAAQTTVRRVTVDGGLRHVAELDAAALDERAHRGGGDVLVGLGVERRDQSQDVPLKGVVPPLEHADGGAPDGVGSLGEPAADGGGAQGDGDGRDGNLGGEREERDSPHVLGRVPRPLHDVGDGKVGDGEGAQDRLADILVLLGAEEGDEGGGDDVVAEVAVLAAVLKPAQRSRRLGSNHGNFIPQSVEHDILHAFVEVVGDLSLDAEGVEDTGDELAHAEPDGPVLGGGQVEKEPEEVFAKLVSLLLGAGGSRRGEMDEESDHALGAQVPLWRRNGEWKTCQMCVGAYGVPSRTRYAREVASRGGRVARGI